MSTYRYAVKVRPWGRYWDAWCQGCETETEFGFLTTRLDAARRARRHAASCEDLHRANARAYCPDCDRFGRIAPACPLCLGEGWIPTTDAARKGLS